MRHCRIGNRLSLKFPDTSHVKLRSALAPSQRWNNVSILLSIWHQIRAESFAGSPSPFNVDTVVSLSPSTICLPLPLPLTSSALRSRLNTARSRLNPAPQASAFGWRLGYPTSVFTPPRCAPSTSHRVYRFSSVLHHNYCNKIFCKFYYYLSKL